MKYGLIGERLAHSFSAEIHPKIADYEYELKEIAPGDVKSFIEAKDFFGINVTIPYKQSVIPYLDYIDDNAKHIGSVNTVVNKNGKLHGYNTDFEGLMALIKRANIDITDKKALILGTGGASLTAKAVLEKLNAKEILFVSRTDGKNKITYEDAVSLHNDAEIIINTTPVGMYPSVDNCAISLDNFKNLKLVADVVYNPLRTDLVITAENKGIKAIGGLYMLVAQAVLSAGYFQDKQFDERIIDEIYLEILSYKRNIVLTGMPASGKSTIGRELSKKLNMPFIDTDDLIVEKIGCDIKSYFENYGEAAFRKVESEVIAEVSLKSGHIIATGGGAVLNYNNVRRLKHNGLIFFLDRALDELLPTEDRPTANTKDAIVKRYNERIDTYKNSNDYTVEVTTPDKTSQAIIDTLNSVTIYKSIAYGEITAPPSKSMAHRLLICAGLSNGKSVIKNVAYSEDILATLDCLTALGAKIERLGDSVEIEGINVCNIKKPTVVNCRESGSTLRFFIPIMFLCNGEGSLTGSEYLFKRPLEIYEEICKKQGILFNLNGNILTLNGKLHSDSFFVKGNISSQFISGLLFCLPTLKNDSYIYVIEPIESRPYIDMTIDALSKFGIEVIWKENNTLFIKGNQTYKPKNLSVEGDYSNAAFLDAFNYIGGNVKVLGLDENSLQGDKIYKKLFNDLKEGRPTIDISDCPDLAPILITLAAMLNGAEFTGTKRLEIKESNRGKVIADELSKLGAHIEVFDDKIIVAKSKLHTPENLLYGHNDHRIVMSLSVISSYFGGKISGYSAVKKSYPDFFEKINELNVNTKYGD